MRCSVRIMVLILKLVHFFFLWLEGTRFKFFWDHRAPMLDQVNFFLDPDKGVASMLGRVSCQDTLSLSRDFKCTLDQQNVFRSVNNRFAKVHSLWLFYIFYQKYILCFRNCVPCGKLYVTYEPKNKFSLTLNSGEHHVFSC